MVIRNCECMWAKNLNCVDSNLPLVDTVELVSVTEQYRKEYCCCALTLFNLIQNEFSFCWWFTKKGPLCLLCLSYFMKFIVDGSQRRDHCACIAYLMKFIVDGSQRRDHCACLCLIILWNETLFGGPQRRDRPSNVTLHIFYEVVSWFFGNNIYI